MHLEKDSCLLFSLGEQLHQLLSSCSFLNWQEIPSPSPKVKMSVRRISAVRTVAWKFRNWLAMLALSEASTRIGTRPKWLFCTKHFSGPLDPCPNPWMTSHQDAGVSKSSDKVSMSRRRAPWHERHSQNLKQGTPYLRSPSQEALKPT